MTLRRTFLGLILTGSLAMAADAGLLSLAMRDPSVVAGIDLDRAKNSPIGRKILADMKDDDKHMQQLLADTGFDPRRDLREIIVLSVGQAKPEQGLVLARGSFDPTRIANFAKAQGATSSLYRGIEVWKGGKGGEGGFAFLDNSIAILGGDAQVAAAIDRKLAGNGGLNQALAAKVATWSATNDAWVISTEPIAGFGPFPNKGGSPQGLSVDSVQAANAGVRFGDLIEITAETTMRSDKDATALADVIRFMSSMVRMNQDKNKAPEAVVNMIDSMQLDTAGNVMKLRLSMPQADLEKMMLNAPASRKRAVAAKVI